MLIVLGLSALASALVGLFVWLDVTRAFDEQVALWWRDTYAALGGWLAITALSPQDALLLAFIAIDAVMALLLFVALYAWARFGLAESPYAWLPVWLAPLWVASGMSGSLFKARAMAALAVTSVPADGGQYERAWRLIQPEAFGFLGMALACGLFGWWLGKRGAQRSAEKAAAAAAADVE